ncbi:Ribosome-recycling factor [Linum grandiflorum]
MAMYLRRAVSSRSSIGLIRGIWSREVTGARGSSSQGLFFSRDFVCGTKEVPTSPANFGGYFKETRRGFAKGKRSKDDSGGGTAEVVPDIGPTVKASAAAQMDAAIDALSRELTKLRTGRASPGMLDHIIVETGGVKMPLSRLAVVSVMDPKTLSVNPYDPGTIKELEKAIVSSPLGLNPVSEGERLIASIPPSTKEHMQAMCKIVTKSSEVVKQSIRRARQKALDTIKKAGSSVPKDEAKRLEKEIDELTKKFVKSAEDMCKTKEKEITQG